MKPLEDKKVALILVDQLDIRTKKTARYLHELGAEVLIICATNHHEDNASADYGVVYLKPGINSGSAIPNRFLRIARNVSNAFLSRFLRERSDAALDRRLIAALKAFEPDFVHAVNVKAIAAAARYKTLAQTPFIYEAYEFWPDHLKDPALNLDEKTRSYFLRLERENIAQADAVITVSDYLADEYQSDYDLQSKPGVVYNAPPTKVAKPSPVHEPLRLLFLGNIFGHLNLAQLLEVVNELEGFELSFQGPGKLSTQIEDFAREKGIEHKLKMLAPVPYEQISESARAHDIGLIAHLAYDRHMEGALPNKLFEYLSGGLAVLASDTEAFRALPDFDFFGRRVDMSSLDEIKQAIEYFKTHREELSHMKKAALRAFDAYDRDAQRERIAHIYAQIF